MTYQPQTETQIQKIEQDERREEMQDEAAQKKDSLQEPQKASAQPQQQDDEEIYIGSRGEMIRRGEEGEEVRDRRQDVRRRYRYRRR